MKYVDPEYHARLDLLAESLCGRFYPVTEELGALVAKDLIVPDIEGKDIGGWTDEYKGYITRGTQFGFSDMGEYLERE